jgi:hypothetical protein
VLAIRLVAPLADGIGSGGGQEGVSTEDTNRDDTEPSSATRSSRTTSPERCAAESSAGYWGSMRLRRRRSARSGARQTPSKGANLVLLEASTTRLAPHFFVVRLMRKMTLP